MHLLCLGCSCNLSGSDSPDGLVGNNNVAPLLWGDDLGNSTKLRSDKRDGLALFALLKGLAAAQDDADVLVESVLGLGGNEGVGLLEDDAALGVAN